MSHTDFSINIIANMSSTSFNVLSTNAVDLQAQLVENKITSVQILREYFAQIDRHEPTLNALISSAPRENVIGIAASLDEERQQGRIRSPLHGIPIILKVGALGGMSLKRHRS